MNKLLILLNVFDVLWTFRNHLDCSYHKSAVISSDNFINLYTIKRPSIVEAIDTDRCINKMVDYNTN